MPQPLLHSQPPGLPRPPSTDWLIKARREGLLALLGAEPWHLLCAILSFTDRDGRRRFGLDQLAAAAGLSPDLARERLAALATISYRGDPLLHLDCDPEGEVIGATVAPLPLFADPPDLAGVRLGEPRDESALLPSAHPGEHAADRDTITRLIPELEALGLTPSQIDWLISRFPDSQIRQQLTWLPLRRPRNPAAMLVRAVADAWPPPVAWEQPPSPPVPVREPASAPDRKERA